MMMVVIEMRKSWAYDVEEIKNTLYLIKLVIQFKFLCYNFHHRKLRLQ